MAAGGMKKRSPGTSNALGLRFYNDDSQGTLKVYVPLLFLFPFFFLLISYLIVGQFLFLLQAFPSL
jgi:hypothetical protein